MKSKIMSSSVAQTSTIVIIFIFLCLFIVIVKGVYDYNRFNNAHEKFLSNYRTKLSDFAKIGSTGVAIAAAGAFPRLIENSIDVVKKDTQKQQKKTKLICNSDTSSSQPLLQKPSQRKRLPWIGGESSSSSSKKRGGNNCLFDATIEACGLFNPDTGKPSNAQELRESCDEVLKEQGFPLIPHGEPAGEQYLQALSFILKRKIKIYRGNRENFVAEIKHSDVEENADFFSIIHTGSQMNGHWVAY